MNPCAWCDKENGVRRPAGVSHGICAMHAAIEVNAARREAVEREIAECEKRVRERFLSERFGARVREGRALPVKWEPAGGKRVDQVIFSAAVLLACAGAGVVAGALVCAWRFANGGGL